jgi:deoxyribose-phosphate aldolase
MKISHYLDATYLKTAIQAGITEKENLEKVVALAKEAISYDYKLVMIRSNYITTVKKIVSISGAKVLIGTVIDFPCGNASLKQKIQEAEKAIKLGADELDFVVNYNAFKKGNIDVVTEEVTRCIALCISHQKIAKFIIEAAALSNEEIIVISQLVKQIVLENFGEENGKNVFVKSSTGFFKTEKGIPNGATFENIMLISKNAKPLKIKAAGGVRDYETALKMISLGVDRIGTSSSKEIINKEQHSNQSY